MSDKKKVDNGTSPLDGANPNDPDVDKISDADIEAAIHGKDAPDVDPDPAKSPAPDSASGGDVDPLKDPTDNSDGKKPLESNEQQDYDALKTELEQKTKSYDELRKKSTQDWQAAAELKKTHDEMQESLELAINKLNETAIKKVDPAQFMEDLQTKGPAALDEHLDIKGKIDAARKEDRDSIMALKKTAASQNYELAFMKRVYDTKNYPDFAELEDKMTEIAADPHCPVDKHAPVEQQLDSYYRLAVDSSSGEAVKKAREEGKLDAEKQLAKEAATNIGGSGKGTGGTPVDLHSIPLDRLEKLLPKADRDV